MGQTNLDPKSVSETTRSTGEKSPPPSAVTGPPVSVTKSDAPASTAPTPPEVALEQAAERWLEGGSQATHGCTVRSIRAVRDRVYLACGLGGLWILQPADAEFTVIEQRDLGGNVSGFFEQAGQLWAVVERIEARPIASLAGSAPRADFYVPPRVQPVPPPFREVPIQLLPTERPSAPLVQETPNTQGRVVRVEGRDVIIDLGLSDGVRPGTHIEFVVPKAPAERDEMDESAYTAVAIGKVRAATFSRARVALGMNELVPVGAYARPTRTPVSASTASPQRVSDVWEVSALVRLFAAIDELGGGLLLDAAVGRRFESAFHLEALIQPFGFASASPGGVGTITAFLIASYDTRLFEIGTGLGAQTVNDPDFFEETGSGTVIPQRLRLGAQDGVNLDLLSSAVLFRQRFRFSGFRGSLQIPLSDSGWLLLFRGGGGRAGYAFGEVALRTLLSGSGHRQSTFFIASVGGAGIFRSQSCTTGDFFSCGDQVSYGGPTIGLGLEHRF